MKKILAVACVAAMAAAICTVASADTTLPSINCPKATSAVTIDGNLNESGWQLENTLGVKYGSPLCTATFGTMWDATNLYVGIHVVDATVINDGADGPYDDDAAEIYVDGNNTKGAYDDATQQFIVRYNDPTIYDYQNGDPVADTPTDIKQATLKTSDGYNVEMAIPWTDLGGISVSAGKVVGFNIHIDDKNVDDATKSCNDILGFSNVKSDYKTSANWANMTLTDAAPAPSSSSAASGSSTAPASTAPESSSSAASTASSNAAPASSSAAPASSAATPASSAAPASSSSAAPASSSSAASSDSTAAAANDTAGTDTTAAATDAASSAAPATATSSNPNTGSTGIGAAVFAAALAGAAAVVLRKRK